MIDPDKVTPGYWYVLNLNFGNSGLESIYEIVHVADNGYLLVLGSDNTMYHKSDIEWFFLAPVPDPIGRPEETIKRLKEDLSLPSSASTADVFRAALSLAKKS
jgi:hypothetical protein